MKQRRSGRPMQRLTWISNAAGGGGVTAAEEESDEDALGWSRPDPEEKATEQRALVTSFEEECQG
jgi:hypothetical protein